MPKHDEVLEPTPDNGHRSGRLITRFESVCRGDVDANCALAGAFIQTSTSINLEPSEIMFSGILPASATQASTVPTRVHACAHLLISIPPALMNDGRKEAQSIKVSVGAGGRLKDRAAIKEQIDAYRAFIRTLDAGLTRFEQDIDLLQRDLEQRCAAAEVAQQAEEEKRREDRERKEAGSVTLN